MDRKSVMIAFAQLDSILDTPACAGPRRNGLADGPNRFFVM
jgi:hypothetical protein